METFKLGNAEIYLMPTLPIHRLCLSIPDDNPHIFNIVQMWEVPKMDIEAMRSATYALIHYHEALRIRFLNTPSGWKMFLSNSEQSNSFSHIDLSMTSPDQQKLSVETHSEKLQMTFDLGEGPLVRVIYFSLGNNQLDRLLLMVHHFVCDAFSMKILEDDLLNAYNCFLHHTPLQLSVKTTLLTEYAERLYMYAQSDAVLQEVPYWLNQPWNKVRAVPVDDAKGFSNPTRKTSIDLKLTQEETKSLAQFAKSGISIRAILLTALFQTYVDWTGQSSMSVELQNHGRFSVFDDVDLTGTVGWMCNLVPLVIDEDKTNDVLSLLIKIEKAIKEIPNNGLGYCALKYLRTDEIGENFHKLPQPKIHFNYLGKYSSSHTDEDNELGITPANEYIKNTQSQKRYDPIHLFVIAQIYDSHLYIRWEFQENLYRRNTMEKLANIFMRNLRNITAFYPLV